ncbi:uncharacterized protein At4g17910-like [Ischnura elegans]|uniref:uncharacterized protein At4g17910-like n=1 Tax=Ischnura elegans TaxID=197161 RepID=UPI001ED86D2F|nr:uncharacterized protein At4g17910-like [Ischnura elegans]
MAASEESIGSYKELQEQFVLNHNGTTLLESAVFLSTPPSALLFWSVALPMVRCLFTKRYPKTVVFLSEFIILVIPVILTCTIFADNILVVSTTLLGFWLLFLTIGLRINFAKNGLRSCLDTVIYGGQRPFITLFRSYTNIITCLCILAVDFRVFPRKFAKTEFGGYGLMDTGTGLFVVANALVSYNPRDPKGTYGLLKIVKSSSPLLLLGIARYVVVSALNYQTHVSEYGSHWNFFFTLALTRALDAVLASVFGNSSCLSIGVQFAFLAVVHEVALSAFGLRQWVFSDQTDRDSWVSANREGLVSLVGYVALHRAAMIIARRIVGVPRRTLRHWLRLWLELASASLVAWSLTPLIYRTTGVSRRLTDVGYICWMLACALISLTFFLGVELTVLVVHHLRRDALPLQEKAAEQTAAVVPELVEAVNYNGLAYFLVANLMTGLVNLSVRTLYVESGLSIAILTLYMLALCALVCVLHKKQIKIKVFYLCVSNIPEINSSKKW